MVTHLQVTQGKLAQGIHQCAQLAHQILPRYRFLALVAVFATVDIRPADAPSPDFRYSGRLSRVL